MSSWGTGIKQSDEFCDIYDDFFDCTLWETKQNIRIYRDSTFNDVKKSIDIMIREADDQLSNIILRQMY